MNKCMKDSMRPSYHEFGKKEKLSEYAERIIIGSGLLKEVSRLCLIATVKLEKSSRIMVK